MKVILIRIAARIFTFIIFGCLLGLPLSRWLGAFIETQIEYDALRQVVVLIGEPLGIAPFTDLDSYLDTIWVITRFILVPWMLLAGVCGVLVCDLLVKLLKRRKL